MAPTLYLWRGLVLLSLFVAAYQGGTPSPSICEAQSDYWFLEVFRLGEIDLPVGVSISISPQGSARGYLSIENRSESPLYILPNSARQSILETEEPQIGDVGLLEEEYEIEESLLVERVLELAVYTLANTQTSSFQMDIQNLQALEPGIVDSNVLETWRPSFVILPPWQRLKLLLVFDGRLYEVPYTISYQLNEGFAPKTCPVNDEQNISTDNSWAEATQESTPSHVLNSITLVFAIMLIAVLVIAAWFLRQTQSQKN